MTNLLILWISAYIYVFLFNLFPLSSFFFPIFLLVWLSCHLSIFSHGYSENSFLDFLFNLLLYPFLTLIFRQIFFSYCCWKTRYHATQQDAVFLLVPYFFHKEKKLLGWFCFSHLSLPYPSLNFLEHYFLPVLPPIHF